MSAPINQITVMSQKCNAKYIIFLTLTLTFDIVHLVGLYYKNKNDFHLFRHVDLNAFLPITFADTLQHYHIHLGCKQIKQHISSGLGSPGVGHPTVKGSVIQLWIFWFPNMQEILWQMEWLLPCKIWGSHKSASEDPSLLGCHIA